MYDKDNINKRQYKHVGIMHSVHPYIHNGYTLNRNLPEERAYQLQAKWFMITDKGTTESLMIKIK